jgi:NADPH:quinone reductase-like Zn-dependent oxidoreductase
MQAVVLKSIGGPEVLVLEEAETPEPGEGEARVKVGASFLARTRDVAIRSGSHPVLSRFVEPPHVLGGECAGTVDAVGPGVDESLVGDRVAVSAYVPCGECPACRAGDRAGCVAPRAIGIQLPGSNAEFVIVPAANLEPIPPQLDLATAAALAANGPIARAQLEAAELTAGDWLLVPGASGSVGSTLVAMAARRGAQVIALTRNPEASGPLSELGAVAVLDPDDEALGELLGEHTGRGLDAVVDNLSLVELWERYSPALGPFARVVFSGRIGDWGRPLPVDIGRLYPLGQKLIGIRTSDANHVSAFWREVRSDGFELPAGMIRSFPLEQAGEAHASLERGQKLGHYVLTVG